MQTLAFSDGTGGGASEYRGLIQYSHLSNSLAFSTNSAERLRIDSSGRLLVGTSSASTTATTLLLQGSPDGASGPSYLRLATGTIVARLSIYHWANFHSLTVGTQRLRALLPLETAVLGLLGVVSQQNWCSPLLRMVRLLRRSGCVSTAREVCY